MEKLLFWLSDHPPLDWIAIVLLPAALIVAATWVFLPKLVYGVAAGAAIGLTLSFIRR